MSHMRFAARLLAIVCVAYLTSASIASGDRPIAVDGRWRVFGAMWQMAGSYVYTFHDESLEIETRMSGGKDGNEPPRVEVDTRTYCIDSKSTPAKLITKTIVPTGSTPVVYSQTITIDAAGTMFLDRGTFGETRLHKIRDEPRPLSAERR